MPFPEMQYLRVLRTFAKLQFAIAGKVKTQIFAFYGTYPEEDLILSEGYLES